MRSIALNKGGPRTSSPRFVYALVVAVGMWMFVAHPARAQDGPPKPAKTSEEIILERIDQLQAQLDELRAALMTARKENSSKSAEAPSAAPATVLPATPAPALAAVAPAVLPATAPVP